ncbi:DUF397 domain-containing protein [Streptosporangium sp. KLBMP 9127]|nr:DUF397 domain-containing protein [Streptosporangium sp. KLBMP 9127]
MDLSRAEWRKSTHSTPDGNNCVEVAQNIADIVAVRDSKNPDGAALMFTPGEWSAFIDGVKAGEFG